jgi:calcineurin-like phosphoesterase family protein
MTTFFTADTHFGHANIIRYCGRPFASVEEMDEAMIATWNTVVGKEDTVFHLGDFALGTDAKSIRAVFARLNGRKRLIVGNHDRQATLDLPWAAKPSHLTETSIDGTRIVMCHYGLRVWPGMRWRAISLYGHSHGGLPGTSKSLDVGVDCWDFAPTTLVAIKARLATLPEQFEPENGREV